MYLYEFLLSTLIGTFQSEVVLEFGLTSFQFSLLSSTVFLLVFSCMQLPAGVIVERYGLRQSLIVSALCITFSCFLMASSTYFYCAMIARAVMGVGASFCLICLLVSVKEWMPQKYSTMLIGLSQLIGTLGPIIAAGPISMLSLSLGLNWRTVFMFLMCMGLLILMCILIFVEDKSNLMDGKKPYKYESIHFNLQSYFVNKTPWLISIVSMSLSFVARYFPLSEGRSFIECHGIAQSHSAFIISMIWIGYAIGSPVLGLVSDFYQQKKKLLMVCSSLLLFAVCVIIYLPSHRYFELLFFAIGFLASSQCICIDLIANEFKHSSVAIGFAIHNLVITFSMAILTPILGLMIDTVSLNTPTLYEYTKVFNFLVIISSIALLLTYLFIREKSMIKDEINTTDQMSSELM